MAACSSALEESKQDRRQPTADSTASQRSSAAVGPDSTEDSVGDTTGTKGALQIEVEYPPPGVGSDSVTSYVRERIALFKKRARAEDIADRRGERQLAPQFELRVKTKRYEAAGTISYVVRKYAHTGGAHGRTTIATFVFGKDGQVLSLADVIPPERREAFMRTLRQKLRSARNVQPEALRNVTFTGLDTFYVTDSEVVVMFSRYEIAPGAAGVISVPLPRGDFVALSD